MTETPPPRHETLPLSQLVIEAGHEHAASRALIAAEPTARLIRQLEREQQSGRLGQEMRWLTWATAALAAVQVGLAVWEGWRP